MIKLPISLVSMSSGFAMKRIVFGIVAAIVMAPGTKAEPMGKWFKGSGQGVIEYGFNDSMGSEINIGCGDGSVFGTSVSVTIDGTDPAPGTEVTFIVDGDVNRLYVDDGTSITTDSQVEASNFDALLLSLKNGKSLTFSFADRDGTSHAKTFPLRGSFNVLAGNNCVADFYR